MNMWRDMGTAEIKEPFLDRPEDIGTGSLPISEGSRVSLSYHGMPLSAQVLAVERLGTCFVGRILGSSAQEDELALGDHVRFRLGDVCGVE
jgi:hypothetical protein